MTNATIQAILKANKMLAPREKTDRLFLFPAGSFDYRGPLDNAIRFIEDFQLLDHTLWEKFVNVFTELPKPDTANKGWRGEYWGKMMRGGCLTYQYTQNPALYKALSHAVELMLAAPEADGRISAYDRDAEFDGWDIWCRKYVMLGLEYFLEICTDEALSARILPVIIGEADYMLERIGWDKLDITKTSTHWEGVNSSSVLEPIVRLFNLTGKRKYLDFATYIVERGAAETQNLFEMAYTDEKAPYEWQVIKAYEIMSCFEGLIEYYRVTGIEKWKEAALRFGKKVYEYEVSIIGSCGCWHELFDNAAKRQLTTVYTGIMQETCVTVTWMKFCLQLLCLSGDPHYADEIERSVYNALSGAINFDKNTVNNGFPFDSYSPLVMGTRGRYVGGRQQLSDGSNYGCCACIGSAGTGLIPLSSMLLREDGVAVNLYIPGVAATHTPDGAALEIAIKTLYPANGAISLTLDTTSEQPFTLALRIPAWSQRTTLALNSQMLDVTPGSYAEINRVWKCGDTVELFLDMRTEVLHPDEMGLPDANAKYHVALRRGPLILARDARLADDLHKPVSIAEDSSGYATEVLPGTVDFACNYAFQVKQTDGSYLPLIDYASAGRTWDNRSLMSAWMHTKDYLPFDETKPFEMVISCFMASGQLPTAKGDLATKTHITQREDGLFYSPCDSDRLVVRTTNRKENTCHLTVADGRHLAITADGLLTLSKKGTPLTLHWQGHNCYAITDPDGRFLEYGRTQTQQPLFFSTGSLIPRHLFDFVNTEE
ncbi:MAG: hypothetical protein E7585_05185 [Ruminococcaceae bacterium]|nr:hypothetical protein [Oscillospiraceae bacterium]